MYIGRNEALDLTDQGYEILRAIGNGQFGRTYLVRRLDNGELRAAKQVDLANLETDDALAAAREPKFLEELTNCPSIVKLYEHFVKNHNLNIVMEYCQGGDMALCLASMRRTGQRFTEAEMIVMLRQILEALAFLHDSFIIHRDLKPSNILIGGDGCLKLADFGVARQLEATLQRARTTVGTPQYMPPEIIMGRSYGYAGDMWALGCVLYEMMTLRPAFEGVTMAIAMRICYYDPREPIGPEWSEPLRNVVSRLLAKEPARRPQARDLLQSSYLNAMPDPLGQILVWESPERALDRVDERDEDTASQHGASPTASDPDARVDSQNTPALAERVHPSVVELCEVILWRLTRSLNRAKVTWVRAMLENEPTLWGELKERAECFGPQSEIQSMSHHIRDMMVACMEEEGEQWLAPASTASNRDPWDMEVTTTWLSNVGTSYDVGLSEAECDKVLSTIALITGENRPTLRSFKRFCSASGKLTFHYRSACSRDESLNETSVQNEVTTFIDNMYRRICERVYNSGIVDDSMEEDFCALPNSDGGVPEEVVRAIIESRDSMGMTEREVEEFLLLSFKTKEGNIRWRHTTGVMTNHLRLPVTVAQNQDVLPHISDKLELLQTKSPLVSGLAVDPPPQTTMTSQQDISVSYSSSRQSERMHKSPSIVLSELKSEALSESGAGSRGKRPSCGGSADFSSGGMGLCEHCLSRPAKRASEVSHISRELSPISLTGRRQRDYSIFSDRGSVYTDANPEVEQFSPSERHETLGLQRIQTLPVEHQSWSDRPAAFGSVFSSQHRLPHTSTARARNAHNATGPLRQSASNQRSSKTRRKAPRRPPLERPDISVRSSREKPGLRTIHPSELAHMRSYNPERDQGGYIQIIFDQCQMEPERFNPPNIAYGERSGSTAESLNRVMAESTRYHESVVEKLLIVQSEPYVTESRLRESLRSLIRDLQRLNEDQMQALHRLQIVSESVTDAFLRDHRLFIKTYQTAVRTQWGLTLTLERLVERSESGDPRCSKHHSSRKNGSRHNHPLMSPASSASNVDRLGTLSDRSEAVIICGADELGRMTSTMFEIMQKLRPDNQGVATCQAMMSLVHSRNNHLRKLVNPPPQFGGENGGSSKDAYEMDFNSLLELCAQIHRACVNLEHRTISDDGLLSGYRRKGAPLSTGLIEDRLPRHQSQISPRQLDSRRSDLFSPDNSQGLQRCTTDYGTNYRNRERHPAKMRSGYVSFHPEDGTGYMRPRYTSGSDNVIRGIDEWNDDAPRCECFH